MNKILLSVVLGLPAPFVFVLGAEPFEVRGKSSITEIVAGCLATTVYLAICQFWVASKGREDVGVKRSSLGAMIAPLLLSVVYIAVKEKTVTFLAQGVPLLVSGFVGSLAGATIAERRRARP